MTPSANPVPPNDSSDLPPEPTDGQQKDPALPHPDEPRPRETPGQPADEQAAEAEEHSTADEPRDVSDPRADEPGMTAGQMHLEGE